MFVDTVQRGGGHGILISKYDATQDKFYVIDSGKYLGGGFEGPVR